MLFVSPERFLNAEFLSVFSTNLSTSLVVVDEAHCISEWWVVALPLLISLGFGVLVISMFIVLYLQGKLQFCPCNSCINLFEQCNRSHNFRPSYTRLRASMLRARLNVGCILAMTATATTTTLHSVMSALAIPQTNLIQKAQLRDNLQLSASLSGNRQVQTVIFFSIFAVFNL